MLPEKLTINDEIYIKTQKTHVNVENLYLVSYSENDETLLESKIIKAVSLREAKSKAPTYCKVTPLILDIELSILGI